MESKNIALQGTLCTSGSGRGVCVGLGDFTVFGRIAKQASRERPTRTTLQTEILRLVIIIASMAFAVAALIVSELLVTHSPLSCSADRIFQFCGLLGSVVITLALSRLPCSLSTVSLLRSRSYPVCECPSMLFYLRCLTITFNLEGLPVCVTLSLTVMYVNPSLHRNSIDLVAITVPVRCENATYFANLFPPSNLLVV
jgi:magnesium-transporting ATPase (P-type)